MSDRDIESGKSPFMKRVVPAGLVVTALLAGCSAAKKEPQTAFVDCSKDPNVVAEAVIDTALIDQALHIGNAASTGEVIEEYDVVTRGFGNFTVTAGTFGDVINREEVQMQEVGPLRNETVGSLLSFSIPPGGNPGAVLLTFHCAPPAQLPPKPWGVS